MGVIGAMGVVGVTLIDTPSSISFPHTRSELPPCTADASISANFMVLITALAGFTVPTLRPVDEDGAMTPGRMRELFGAQDAHVSDACLVTSTPQRSTGNVPVSSPLQLDDGYSSSTSSQAP